MSAALGLFRYAMYRAELAVLETAAGPLTVRGRGERAPVAASPAGHQPSP